MKKNFWENRTVMACVIAVTVFLCVFTFLQLVSIKMTDSAVAEEKIQQPTGGQDSSQQGQVSDETWEMAGNIAEVPDSEALNQITEIEKPIEMKPEQRLPYYLKINRQQNVVTVYGQDEMGEYNIPVKAILCSTGKHNATPKGVFRLSSKYVWHQLNGGVFGQYATRITGGILFHSVPYANRSKASLYWSKYNQLGQQASQGCVRLTVEDAKWIYDNCPSGTKVEIYDDSKNAGPLGKPEALKLDKDNVNKGWDPTDPDERNPWHQWSEDN